MAHNNPRSGLLTKSFFTILVMQSLRGFSAHHQPEHPPAAAFCCHTAMHVCSHLVSSLRSRLTFFVVLFSLLVSQAVFYSLLRSSHSAGGRGRWAASDEHGLSAGPRGPQLVDLSVHLQRPGCLRECLPLSSSAVVRWMVLGRQRESTRSCRLKTADLVQR